MSIVGPRPERPAFIEELSHVIDGYQDRLRVPPGITGLAQVRHKHDESLEDVGKKLQYDREYIKKISLIQDLAIILQTIGLVFDLCFQTLKGRSIEEAEPKAPDSLLHESGRLERG